ncbi:hypothetical protein HMPREF9058_1664 [Actinomyces sp. oral taxon 175 str. F0384]|nr:hypothetical protein HMPREF9058_1664 [Actinomyces sp. oral taxon 175 str. F0384]
MEWTAPEEEHARTDIKRAPSATRRRAKDVHIGDKGLDHSHADEAKPHDSKVRVHAI